MGHQPIASVTITVEIALFRMMPSGLEVLLVRRDNHPHQGERVLPGGSVNESDETLDQAIVREVREQTGLTIPAKHLRQVGTYGDIGRDSRGRSVSVLYTLVEMVPDCFQVQVGDDASAADWFTPFTDRPHLAFDHDRLLNDAIQYLHDWRRLVYPGTQCLSKPRQCEIGSEFGERCPLPAHWEVNGWAMCEEDIKILAGMNSENAELVRPALDTMHPHESEVIS